MSVKHLKVQKNNGNSEGIHIYMHIYFKAHWENMSYWLGLINYEIKHKTKGHFNILKNYILPFLIKDIGYFLEIKFLN